MQHWNLVVVPLGMMELPAVGPVSVSPASTNMLPGRGGLGTRPPMVTMAHSGAGIGLPDSALSGATNPPPKFLTLVNVCVSPLRFSNDRTVPGSAVPAAGSKCHAPTFWAVLSSAIKWLNVMVPSPTHVPGPTAALNVAGSQGPCIRTTNGSLAAINAMEAAIGIIASTTAAYSLDFFMSLPSV